MGEGDEPITLLDEEGKVHEFNLLDVVELGARRYAILQPTDADDAVVFRVEDDALVAIEDEEEFNRVVRAIEAEEEYDEVEVARERLPLTDVDDDEGDGGHRSKVN